MTGCKCTKDNMKDFLKSISAMQHGAVYVGIPAEKAGRKGDEMTNAVLGYIHENGSPAAHIPPRPFLVPGVRAVNKETIEDLKQGAIRAFTEPGSVRKSLDRVGLRAAASVKKTIVAMGDYPADSPTVAARKREGFKGMGILRRTSQMLNSVTYVIRNK